MVHPDDREDFTYDPCDPLLKEIDPGDPCRMRRRYTGTVLAEHLERLLQGAPRRARFAVDPKANRETHLRWHRAAAHGDARWPLAAEGSVADSPDGPPLATLDIRDLGGASLFEDDSDGLVLIVDGDAEREPRLAATLVAAARRSPGTGFFTSLGSFDVETQEGLVSRCFLPTGGPAAFGVAANCFGAGVVLARRSALRRARLGDANGAAVGSSWP